MLKTLVASQRSKTLLVFIDQTFVSGINFLTGLLLARFLGLEGYGVFVLVYGVVLFFSGVQMALIITPMMVMGPRLSSEKKISYYQAVVVQQFLFCFIVGGVVVISGGVLNWFIPGWRFEAFIWPLALLTIAFLSQDFFRRYFFTLDRAGSAFVNDLTSYGLQFVILVLLGFTIGFRASAALWVIGLTSLLAVFLGLAQYCRDDSWQWPSLGQVFQANRLHWDFGKWLGGQNIAYWIGNQSVVYLTAGVLSVTAVGAMSAARNIVGVANILFLAMQNLVPVRASRIYTQHGISALNCFLKKVSLLGGGATLVLVGIAICWQEFWLQLVYGNEYQGYGWLIQWWGIYYLLSFFHRPYSFGLYVLSHTKAVFLSSLVGAVASVLVVYPALKIADIAGGMFAANLVQVVVLLLLAITYKKSVLMITSEQY
ncbi:MAG: hypothetical protein ACD_66C00277G0002 [uncultured bacterium]|nr:MAG: hypothetical protein ACD_66C00277G0002 [uncultured bacterium]